MSNATFRLDRRNFLLKSLKTILAGCFLNFTPYKAFGRDVDLSENDYFPYNIDWDIDGQEGFHIGDLVGHKPAGKYGEVTVKDGHFHITGHGYIRFWGTNLVFDDNFPPHENAKKIASRMAKLGFNLVRFHHMDGFFSSGALCDKYYLKTGKLNPDVMDRLCFLINELKKNGIYYNLNLLTFRRFDHIKTLPQNTRLLGNKDLTFFSPELQAIHRKFIHDVLMWENKYTGLKLGQDPAMAMVESNNEDSLMSFLAKNSRGNRVPPYYYNQLNIKFNQYLKEKYKTDKSIKEKWGKDLVGSKEKIGQYDLLGKDKVSKLPLSGERLTDVVNFLIQLERNHYSGIKKFLIDELKCKSLLGGVNNWYSHAGTVSSIDSADYIDMHGYFNKKIRLSRWGALKSLLKNKLSNYYMVLDVNYLAYINETAQDPDVQKPYWQLKNDFFKYPKNYVEGIPCSLSEWNHSGPTKFGYDMPLLISAYASFQDWDSLAQFHYHGHVEEWTTNNFITKGYNIRKNRLFYKNSSAFDPSLMSQTPAASLAFRRGDISIAKNTILLDLTDEQKLINALTDDKYDTRMALKHRIRKIYKKGKHSGKIVPEVKIEGNPKIIQSDTDEIVWETAPEIKKGRVLVNSPRTQAASGNLEMGIIKHRNIIINATTSGAIWITSLSTDPIDNTNEFLLTITGNSENTGVKYETLPYILTQSKIGYFVSNPGRTPVLMRKVKGFITVKGLANYDQIAVYPLGQDCKPKAAIKVNLSKDGFSMNLDAEKTAMYRIRIQRKQTASISSYLATTS